VIKSLPVTDFVEYPQGNVLLRDLRWKYPVISHGEGVYLFDTLGNQYIDGCGGAFVSCLGHNNSDIVEAVFEQCKKVAYINGKHFTSQASEDLATLIASLSPPGLNKVAMLNSGSDAVEAALKFALQVHAEKGNLKKKKIIARTPGYHGNTFMALSMSARPAYKKFFGMHLSPILFVDACYEYRNQVPGDYFSTGADFYIKQLEDLIQKENPEEIAALIVEPMGASSTLGSLPPNGFLERMQKLCEKHNILTISDEVACGSGRTGKFYASQHWNFEPDVMVLGKSINAGYMPLALVIVQQKHLDVIHQNSGSYLHAQTYLQSPGVAACGLAVVQKILKEGLMDNCTKIGSYIQDQLMERLKEHPHVGFITGKGMMMGVEFVKDRSSKKAFDRKEKVAEGLAATAFKNGAIVWVSTGMADDVNGDGWVVAPPYIMDQAHADELVDKLVNSIEEYFKK